MQDAHLHQTGRFFPRVLGRIGVKLDGKVVGDKAQKEAIERGQKVSAIARKLCWSDKRLAIFKRIVVDEIEMVNVATPVLEEHR